MVKIFLSCVALLSCLFFSNNVHAQQATNPIIFADVPDMSVMRVGDTYYMSSTTIHMSPGVPIMKSKDFVNWQVVSYTYDTLANMDELNLINGKKSYGLSSWATSTRNLSRKISGFKI